MPRVIVIDDKRCAELISRGSVRKAAGCTLPQAAEVASTVVGGRREEGVPSCHPRVE